MNEHNGDMENVNGGIDSRKQETTKLDEPSMEKVEGKTASSFQPENKNDDAPAAGEPVPEKEELAEPVAESTETVKEQPPSKAQYHNITTTTSNDQRVDGGTTTTSDEDEPLQSSEMTVSVETEEAQPKAELPSEPLPESQSKMKYEDNEDVSNKIDTKNDVPATVSGSSPKPETVFPDTTPTEPKMMQKAAMKDSAAVMGASIPTAGSAVSRATARERQDAMAKQRARGTSTTSSSGSGAISASNQPPTMPGDMLVATPQTEPVTSMTSAVSQERQDAMAKQRARGSSRMSHRAGAVSEPGSAPIPGAVPDAHSQPEPPAAVSAATSQERQDAVAKQRSRATSRMSNRPGAITVPSPSTHNQPVDHLQQVAPQQEADIAAKNRARGSTRVDLGPAMVSGATEVAPSAKGPPVETVQAVISQQESDLMAKNRAGRTSRSVETPGARSVTPATQASSVHHIQQAVESDTLIKDRARGSSLAAGGVVPGAMATQPSQLEPTLSSGVNQKEDDIARDRALRSSRRQQQGVRPAEQDTIAKSRARRSVPSETDPSVVPGAIVASLPVEEKSVDSSEADGLNELARRREERAASRADRRSGRDFTGGISVTSRESSTAESRKMARNSVASSAASTAGSSVATRSTFSNMSENERRRRYDAKMAQMDQPNEDSLENHSGATGNSEPAVTRNIASVTASTQGTSSTFSNMSEDERRRRYDLKMGQIQEHHEKYDSTSPEKSGEFRSDVEYGEHTPTVVDDNDLAVAIAIDEDEEEDNNKSYAYAVEYDPNSKPPIYQNRRFRLYGIGGAVCFIVLAIVLVVGVLSSKKDGETALLTLEPTAAPTGAPTTARESTYRNYFAQVVSRKVLQPGTPHFSAAEWIMNEDPLQLEPSHPDLLQRYLLTFFYFHTTNNGAREWRSCNPPKDGEDDTCEFLEFSRRANDTIVYVPRSNRVRWLSGRDECDWVGVECAGGSVVLGFRLFGQRLVGTLPTELAALPVLQRISVPYNELEGPLPAEYASLNNLLDIEVHGNMLTGTIPSEYFEKGSMTLLNFNIGDNAFSGTLDTRIGLMTDLKGLHIFENNLRGDFPTEIGKLNYLSFSRVNGNEFTGPVPSELGRLGQLSELWYHENLFSGTIPSELGRLYRLQDFRLWGNSLTGKIPDELFNMTKLRRFSVREMALTGTLSTLVGQLTGLQQLKVSTNELAGPIPSEIQSISSLVLVWLHYNQFTGQVPDPICNLVGPDGLQFLQADCHPVEDPPNPCRCCSACCNREEGVCLTNELNQN